MLRQLLEPESARQFLSQNLPLLREQSGHHLTTLRLRDIRRRKWWQLQYHLEIETQGASRPSQCIVTCHYSDTEDLSRIARRLRRHQESACQGRHVLEERWLDRSAEGLLIVPFPLDIKLPHLCSAMAPDQAERKLRESGFLSGAQSATAAEVLRYVPGKRCQIRYHFRARSEPETLLGKTFKDGRGRTLNRRMNQVHDLYRLNGNPELAAPRSPGYLDEWKMVVQEDVPATTLKELARTEALEEEHLTRAAQCLAVLHRSSLRFDNYYSVEKELALLQSAHEQLQHAGFASPSRRRLLKEILLWGEGLNLSSLCPVHRDFYDKQVLIHGSRLWLIDLDTLTCGPPEIDLANFVAHLYLRSLQGFQFPLEQWAELFLDSYGRSASRPDAFLVRFFLAAAFFRLGCRYTFRFHGRELTQQLLELAGEALGNLTKRWAQKSLAKQP